jgi:hypothetical protein
MLTTNRLKNLRFFLLTGLLTSTSCKSLYDLKNYSKSSAKGSISGREWTFAYAYTDPEAKLPDGMETMIVLLTAKPKHACPTEDDKVADAREVAIAVDGKTGEMKIGRKSGRFETEDDMFTYTKAERHASVAFHNPSMPDGQQYVFATSGKVKITRKTPDLIEGAVVAKLNENQFVNGQFKAKVCKYGQLN